MSIKQYLKFLKVNPHANLSNINTEHIFPTCQPYCFAKSYTDVKLFPTKISVKTLPGTK